LKELTLPGNSSSAEYRSFNAPVISTLRVGDIVDIHEDWREADNNIEASNGIDLQDF